MALLAAKVPFGEEASKGGFTICDAPKLCSAENTIFIVLSAMHSFAEIKECKLKKTELYQQWGAVCQYAKRCVFVLDFLVVLFFSQCFCSFVL